jgi:hypothetical protein
MNHTELIENSNLSNTQRACLLGYQRIIGSQRQQSIFFLDTLKYYTGLPTRVIMMATDDLRDKGILVITEDGYQIDYESLERNTDAAQ